MPARHRLDRPWTSVPAATLGALQARPCPCFSRHRDRDQSHLQTPPATRAEARSPLLQLGEGKESVSEEPRRANQRAVLMSTERGVRMFLVFRAICLSIPQRPPRLHPNCRAPVGRPPTLALSPLLLPASKRAEPAAVLAASAHQTTLLSVS